MTVISELRMRAHPTAPKRGWDASVKARLLLTFAAMTLLLIGANLATPLYPLLQEQLGLGPFAVTLAFASYVLALITGLVLYGHWSDHIGRRAALVVAVLVGLAGALVFGMATGLGGLIFGRILQGAAVALCTGASSAALRELLPRNPEWASRLTLLASSSGVAAGPLLGGALGVLPRPDLTPFLLLGIALLLVLVPLWVLHARPAMAPAPGAAVKALRPRRLGPVADARVQFRRAASIGFLSFALFGFGLSLAPRYFADLFGITSMLGIGTLAALTLMASAAAQLLGRSHRKLLPVALTVMATGIVLIAVAGSVRSLPLLIAASLLAGAGQGTAFRTAFNDVALAVEPARHSQVISTVYVVTYLGSAVPVLCLGLVAGLIGLPAAVAWFAGIIAAGCLAVAISVLAHRQLDAG